MYTVLAAAMHRKVVAVDADPENLAYIRKSLELKNTANQVRLFSNAVSDEYSQIIPYSPDRKNSGGTVIKTLEEAKQENLNIAIVRSYLNNMINDVCNIATDTGGQTEGHSGHGHHQGGRPQDRRGGARVQGESQQGNGTFEILTFVVLQALQEEIILNKIGKFIPYIFLEWGQLPNNKKNCKHFTKWVEHFYSGGYVPLDSGEDMGSTHGPQVCCLQPKW